MKLETQQDLENLIYKMASLPDARLRYVDEDGEEYMVSKLWENGVGYYVQLNVKYASRDHEPDREIML